ncbi:hypothetical protein BG000_004044, partial [Podila horticola]
TIGKSSKQRNYNFDDSRVDAGSCGLISNDKSDTGSCAPASGKKHKDPKSNRLSVAIEDDVSTNETPSKDPSKAKERESIQEEDDDQGSKREDGLMIESEEERVDREERETIVATIEAEIKREEAESRKVNKDEYDDEEEEEEVERMGDREKSTDNDNDEEEEDEGASDSDMHQLVESLFQGDQEFTEEEEYRKEDRLGQAGPLETMDDEE